MELDWSKQTPHICTLYHPWQPDDGYKEDVIVATEARLGVRLPAPLRIFYRAWGQRKDVTQTNQVLLRPNKLVRWPDALIFCVENQGGSYWALEGKALEEADPPVVRADTDALVDWEIEEIPSPLIWTPSHAHVSDFLDSLTYQHAFWGGAMHGGSGRFQFQEFHEVWLKQHWQRIMARPLAFPLMSPEYGEYPLYIRDGLALELLPPWCSVVARSVEDLDAVGQILQVTWEHRW